MIRVFSIIAFLLLSTTCVHAQPSTPPLSLSWGTTIAKTFREIPGFQYYYGDIQWGEMIFTGSLFNLDAEVQIRFLYQKITDATLILGPRGLGDFGCLTTYRNIVKLMVQKYGNPFLKKIQESEIKEELVYSTICSPIRTGLHVIETHWNTKDFYIIASIFGDDVDIFIEVEYVYKPLRLDRKKHDTKKALKHL